MKASKTPRLKRKLLYIFDRAFPFIMLGTWIRTKLASRRSSPKYDADRKEKIIRVVQTYNVPLSILLFFVGIVWILLLPYEGFNRTTYISENALLPGQVNVYFGYNDIRTAEDYRYQLTHQERQDSEVRATYIMNEFRGLGFDSALQRFNTSDDGMGVNAFAVYRAPRSDGKEALILSAPWQSRTGDYNTNGIAALLSLAKLFKRNVYWSKDIILLVTDKGMVGTRSWVDAYHGTGPASFSSLVMPRSGAIQGVVNLDFPGTQDYENLGIFFEGVNGQLPNLDLINTIVTVCTRTARVPLTLHDDSARPFNDKPWGPYVQSLLHMTRTMQYQALGHPSSDAGLYLRYKIDAVTVHGVRGSDNLHALFGFHKIGIMLESTFRSLNNLLEHFHQSFFFYLLLRPNRYVSIGDYMPPIILFACSLIFQSLALYYIRPSTAPGSPEKKAVASHAVTTNSSSSSRSVSSALTVMIVTHLMGFAIFYIMQTTSLLGYTANDSEALVVVQFALSCCIAVITVICTISSHRGGSRHATDTPNNGRTLKSFCLAFSGLVISTVSLLNFSLAVVTAVLIVLPYTFIRSSSSWIARVLQCVILTLISPPGLAALAVAVGGLPLSKLLSMLIEDYQVVGSWLLLYICVAYWPVNLAMQILVFT
ncbi:Gaa1-like protein [Zychaea mexicana]|uniref:Gaa1-like protein n=1 Tax=Zychaea mexicana TaxID=64656 RepID=UPI0022FE9DBC|nr:Gaa1-like protein [Zychaea mexicana]KAI9493887.1 Gaa1-like protein [Zychaea mexicana]